MRSWRHRKAHGLAMIRKGCSASDYRSGLLKGWWQWNGMTTNASTFWAIPDFIWCFLLFYICMHFNTFTKKGHLNCLVKVCILKTVGSDEKKVCCYYCPIKIKNAKKYFFHCFFLSEHIKGLASLVSRWRHWPLAERKVKSSSSSKWASPPMPGDGAKAWARVPSGPSKG